MGRVVDLLTKEEIKLLASYKRKVYAGLSETATAEEREASRKYSELQHKLNPIRYRYLKHRHRAKARGISFGLTFETFVLLCENTPVCPVLGIPLDFEVHHGKGWQENAASLDRLDNDRGYEEGNCWIISMKANQMKSNANLEELKLLVSALEARLNNVTEI